LLGPQQTQEQPDVTRGLRRPTKLRMMHIETFAVGPLGCNCSIVADPVSKRAIVIDPGGDFEAITARLVAGGFTVDALIHTHTHIDHVGATAPLQRRFSSRACIHEADRFLYDMLPVQAAMLGIPLPEKVEMTGDLVDGQALSCGGFELGVLHTPGHTPGSSCFVLAHGDQQVVFTGDTLFRGGIGRTDLWGGDQDVIMKSLHNKLLTLPAETVVVAGHGPSSNIAREKSANPYLRAQ
jgi:hydroxyacylglutathione hydrolase